MYLRHDQGRRKEPSDDGSTQAEETPLQKKYIIVTKLDLNTKIIWNEVERWDLT